MGCPEGTHVSCGRGRVHRHPLQGRSAVVRKERQLETGCQSVLNVDPAGAAQEKGEVEWNKIEAPLDVL